MRLIETATGIDANAATAWQVPMDFPAYPLRKN